MLQVEGMVSLEKAAGYVRPLQCGVHLLTLAHDQVAREEGWRVSTCVQCDRTSSASIPFLQVDDLRAVGQRPVHVRLTVLRELPRDPFLGRLRLSHPDASVHGAHAVLSSPLFSISISSHSHLFLSRYLP